MIPFSTSANTAHLMSRIAIRLPLAHRESQFARRWLIENRNPLADAQRNWPAWPAAHRDWPAPPLAEKTRPVRHMPYAERNLRALRRGRISAVAHVGQPP
jgi:hypothetical protein